MTGVPLFDRPDVDGELVRIAHRGEIIRREMAQTEAVKVILERAEADGAEALNEFLDSDPNDPVKVRALWSRMWRARQVRLWLEEAIEAGDEAFQAAQQLDAASGDEVGTDEPTETVD